MTQWLIEEAAFAALEFDEANMRREASEKMQDEQRLLDRHAELMAMREAQRGVR